MKLITFAIGLSVGTIFLAIAIIMAFSTTVPTSIGQPVIAGDEKLVIQKIVDHLDMPSSLEFLGKDILIIHRNSDKVSLVRNFDLKKYPVLDINPFNFDNQTRLSGITSKVLNNTNYVLIFFSQKSSDQNTGEFTPADINRVYRYQWNSTSLELLNSTLILELPSAPVTPSDSIIVGPDSQLYTVINESSALNNNDTGQSLILRTTLDGQPSQNNSSEISRFKNYFASGILNFSGMTFDPVTNLMWDVEKRSNGVTQINLIRPGFNGSLHRYDVVGSYSNPPESTWSIRSPVTAITIINASSLGSKFNNTLATGDEEGNIYFFGLDKERRNLSLNQNLSKHLFASGFGPISDLKIGTDGALYVLALARNSEESGSLYRISTSGVDLPVPQSKYIRADYWGLALTFTLAIVLITCAEWLMPAHLRFVFQKIKRLQKQRF